MKVSKLHHIDNRQSAAHLLQSKMSVEALEATQKLFLKSCGIHHAYLHVPLAAFEDSGFFCVLYPLTDKVAYPLSQNLFWVSVASQEAFYNLYIA